MTTRTFWTVIFLATACAVFSAPALAETAREPQPLSLKEAVAQALERNLDIALARIDPLAEAQSVITNEAQFDPSLELGGSWTHTLSEPANLLASSSRTFKGANATITDPLQTGGYYSVGFQYGESNASFPPGSQLVLAPQTIESALTLSVSQPLLRNYGLSINTVGIEIAMKNVEATRYQVTSRVLQTIEAVESGYWTLVGARRQVEVARASLDLAKDFLRQTKIKVEVGTLPPIEITTAEAEVAAREEAVIVAENAVRNAEDSLRALMRVSEDSPDWGRPLLPTDEPGFAEVMIDEQAAIDTAWAKRPEIAQALLTLESDELTLRYRRNQIRPDWTVGGDYSVSGNNYNYKFYPGTDGVLGTFDDETVRIDQGRWDSLKEIPDRKNADWTIRTSYKIPIKNRTAKADLLRAQLAMDQNRLRLENIRQQVRVEVRQAVRNLETAARRVDSARANVALQRKKVEAEQKRYENGLSIAFKVLEFQNDLRDAESREINAIVDFNKAQSSLARVKATLLEERGVALN